MAEHNHYVPIVPGRQGEYHALAALRDESRARITPLIEVPPVPWDFENDAPAKSLDDHLGPVAEHIAQHWGTDRPVFVDLAWIAEDETGTGHHPVRLVLDDARARSVQTIPVVGMDRTDLHIAAVRDVISGDNRGVCIRLEPEDIRNVARLGGLLNGFCDQLGVERDAVDLLLDFKDYDSRQASAISIAASVAVAKLPNAPDWRSLTLAGGGFPINLSGIKGEGRIPRADWEVWRDIAIDNADELPRRPAFGDYAVQHPEPQEVDPRLMKMSAAIRYTTPTEWLVLKRKNVRDFGFGQFHDLAGELITKAEFRGADFSDGDCVIQACAERTSGTGNAKTWRQVATNHHIETVVEQLATLP
jgi:hypothetical protein